jgi:hypothetical protein
MSPSTNNWKRTEHRFYVEIVTDNTTQISERKDT